MSSDVVLIAVGGLVLGVGLLSNVLKRLWLSAPLVALLAGVALGPELLGVLDPFEFSQPNKVLEEAARLTLAFSLTATGLQFTRRDLRENGPRAALLLSVGMVGMWALTTLGAFLLLDLPFWVAALIGAILTPTDPVVASTIVTGRLAEKNLPRWLRRTLQLESGANDGLAIAFVLLPVFVLTEPADEASLFAGEAAVQVGIALALGPAIGYLVARLVNVLGKAQEIERAFFFAVAVAMALLVIGATHSLGGSGVLAAFLAGVTFSLTVREEYAEMLEEVLDAVERVFLVPVFALFGTLIPFSEWEALGAGGLAFCLWVLLLRRPPVVPAALAPTGTERRGISFLGWFGPLGVAAIYYSVFVERYPLDDYETVFGACTLAIAASIVVHSVTATPAVRRYAGRRATATLRHPLDAEVDDGP